jgi:recombination protein RecT
LEEKSSDKIVGFVSYFELINGFKSTLYMTVDEVKNTDEIKKTFGSQYGVWKTEFESMALKTVTKLNLSKCTFID